MEFFEKMRSDRNLAMTLRLKRKRAADEGERGRGGEGGGGGQRERERRAGLCESSRHADMRVRMPDADVC